jgi:cytochrome b561
MGAHNRDVASAPPSPEPMHWLTVAAVTVALPTMLLMMEIEQSTVPPPLFTEPLHWVTEVTTWLKLVTTGAHGTIARAAP